MTPVVVGVLVAVGAVVANAALTPAPRPDATLHPTGDEPDDLVLRLLAPPEATELEIDLSTLRSFGPFAELELWAAVNAFDSPCLIAIHRATEDVLGTSCVPAGADPMTDTMWHGLPGGANYRFVLHDDTVDAYVLMPEEVE